MLTFDRFADAIWTHFLADDAADGEEREKSGAELQKARPHFASLFVVVEQRH